MLLTVKIIAFKFLVVTSPFHTQSARSVYSDHSTDQYDVALDSEGCLYISECGNHCITKLSATGQYMSRFGTKGSAPGQLYRPSGLCVNDNLVYVVEDGGDRVSIFDVSGKVCLLFWKKRK